MTLYRIGFSNGKGATDITDSLPKARAIAVRLLKSPSRAGNKIMISKAREIQGFVALNRFGKGIWVAGGYSWYISKNGKVYNKEVGW